MATPQLIDLEQLMQPVPGDSPCGVSLSWDPVYERIKKARRETRDLLSEEEGEADWKAVIRDATEALAQRTKDLQLAAWLAEALTREYGFAGLRDGLMLVVGLLDTFWDEGLYPLPDDDGDLGPRVAPLEFLAAADRGARLPNRLREVPLLAHGTQVLSWSYWKSRYASPKSENEEDDRYQQRRMEAEERARVFEAAVADTDRSTAEQLFEDIRQATDAVERWAQSSAARCGDLAPGVTAFREALGDCEALVRRIVKDKGGFTEAVEEAGADGSADEESGVAGNGQGGASAGPIRSRNDAFRRLVEVADYLRRTEPQSPVPLLIDRAVAWGRLPFDQLIQELIKDQSARSQVSDLLGIRAGDSHSGGDESG